MYYILLYIIHLVYIQCVVPVYMWINFYLTGVNWVGIRRIGLNSWFLKKEYVIACRCHVGCMYICVCVMCVTVHLHISIPSSVRWEGAEALAPGSHGQTSPQISASGSIVPGREWRPQRNGWFQCWAEEGTRWTWHMRFLRRQRFKKSWALCPWAWKPVCSGVHRSVYTIWAPE